MKKLSIIIPVYNEEKTLSQVIRRVEKVTFSGIEKEIIIVNDGSSDDSKKIIEDLKLKNVKFFSHTKNAGKGSAVRTGLEKATGEYVIIQDADLEYDPQDILKLIKPIQEGKATVVYGTRLKRLPNLMRDERTGQFLLHYVGNKFLSLITSMLYLSWVTDMESCYKLFPKSALEGIILRARG